MAEKRSTVPNFKKMQFYSITTISIFTTIFANLSVAAPTPLLELKVAEALKSIKGPLGLATVLVVPFGAGALTAKSISDVKKRVPRIP